MLIDIAAILSLIFSLFLFFYAIRSIIFLHISKKVINKYNNYLLSNLPFPTIKGSPEIMRENKYHAGFDTDKTLGNEENYSNRQSFKARRSVTNNTIGTDIKVYCEFYPFISILIATHNESLVIDNLMRSCSALTYDRSRFEIVVVDDSTDNTLFLLKQWEHRIPNLKLIHRTERTGWKGGALNVALKNMQETSSYALIVDADNVLINDTLERFVSCFLEHNKKCTYVIQGFPLLKINPSYYIDHIGNNNDHHHKTMNLKFNWVANAIDFRLAQKNIVELLAKDRLNLPVQVTGSLFMIRSQIIKTIGFSNDLTEDWDLTLDLNLNPKMQIYDSSNNCDSSRERKKVSFNALLISYCEATTKIREYLKQRIRVSEGHTRGFRKRMWTILKSKIPITNKIELFFTGLHFTKFVAIFALTIIDILILLLVQIPWNANKNNYLELTKYLIEFSLIMQLSSFLIGIITTIMAIPILKYIKNYDKRNVIYLLLLNLITMPALVIGSLLGFCRNKGTFYQTKRNIFH